MAIYPKICQIATLFILILKILNIKSIKVKKYKVKVGDNNIGKLNGKDKVDGIEVEDKEVGNNKIIRKKHF